MSATIQDKSEKKSDDAKSNSQQGSETSPAAKSSETDNGKQEHGAKGEKKLDSQGHDETQSEKTHDESQAHEATGEPRDPTIEEGMDHYLDPGHLFGHVQDADYFELPRFLGLRFEEVDSHGHKMEVSGIKIPNPLGRTEEKPLVSVGGKPFLIGRPTKFMVLEIVGAILLVVVFMRLAQKVQGGKKPAGRLWHALEATVVFIRDDIAKPCIGGKDTNRFLPFLLTLFFFILILNLFGMIPMLGSATGALAVTSVFAVATFLVVIISGMKKMGVIGFLKAQVPSMEMNRWMAMILVPSIWAIEIFGLFVKHFVLAIRLFANMFAGHLVLAVFLGFVGAVWASGLFYGVTPAVILGSIAIGLLELFVAFLQAYIFTFLAALFIGAAQHAH